MRGYILAESEPFLTVLYDTLAEEPADADLGRDAMELTVLLAQHSHQSDQTPYR